MSKNEIKCNLNSTKAITRGISMNGVVTSTHDKKINFGSKNHDFDSFFKEIKNSNSKVKDIVIEDEGHIKTIILKTSDISIDERMKLTDDTFIKLLNYGKNIGMGDLIDIYYVDVAIEE